MKLLYKNCLYESKNYLTLSQLIDKYKNGSNYYIAFRSINKIGINPQSGWDSPIGVYTYNLENTNTFPYTGCKYEKHCYAFILSAKENAKKLNLQKYSKNDLIKDINKLKNLTLINEDILNEYYTKFNLTESEDINYDELELALQQTKNKPIINYGKNIWNIVKNLSSSTSNWNKILISLGYDYVEDEGQGIIHENEPFQTVFLNPSSYVVIDSTVLK